MTAIPWGLPYKKDESDRRTFKRLKSGFSTFKAIKPLGEKWLSDAHNLKTAGYLRTSNGFFF